MWGFSSDYAALRAFYQLCLSLPKIAQNRFYNDALSAISIGRKRKGEGNSFHIFTCHAKCKSDFVGGTVSELDFWSENHFTLIVWAKKPLHLDVFFYSLSKRMVLILSPDACCMHAKYCFFAVTHPDNFRLFMKYHVLGSPKNQGLLALDSTVLGKMWLWANIVTQQRSFLPLLTEKLLIHTATTRTLVQNPMWNSHRFIFRFVSL